MWFSKVNPKSINISTEGSVKEFKTRLQLHQLDTDVQENACFYMEFEPHLNTASKS